MSSNCKAKILKIKKTLKKRKTVNPTLPKNALCRLHEMFRGLAFQTTGQEGPVHAPVFTITVKVNGKVFQGRGKSKKLAKHNAAEAALRTLGQDVHLPGNNFELLSGNASSDFTSDISYEEVNMFDPCKTPASQSSNGSENGLPEMKKTLGLNPPVHPTDKSPVMLLNGLYPNIKYNVIAENALEHSRYTTEVIINDRRFEGTGSSKKLSKAAAARSALAVLHNISYTPIDPNKGFGQDNGHTSEIPQVFADHVSSLLGKRFLDLMENNLTYARRKIFAGVVLSKGYDQESCKVISVCTGTKCINGEYLSTYGTVVSDSHAEIISRRCVVRFLYSELLKHRDGSNPGDSILELVPAGNGFRLKPNYLFHLYISTAPCGDSRIFSPHDEQTVDKHPNRKARGLLRTKIESGEGTIPVKSNKSVIQTWDGILQGERLLTMSCSDKIVKWNVVGIQGALLSNFIEPIYLDSIILGSLFHPEHLRRALYGRIENILQALPPPYRLNKPKMALISSKEERQVGKPPSFSVNWTIGDESSEIVSCGTGKTEQNEVSRLAKCNMFARFLGLVGKVPSLTLTGFHEAPRTYKEWKDKSVLYQTAKQQLNTAFEKADLGYWIKKPFEVEEFECNESNIPQSI